MTDLKRRLITAATVIACATPALAPPAWAQDVPPPAKLDEAGILAWAKSAKISDDTTSPAASWELLGASDEGLHMAVIQQRRDAAGIAKVGVRLERFKPAGANRSEAEFYDLDCGKSQIKSTMAASFASHNLTGAKQDKPTPSTWSPAASNDLVAAISEDACKAVSSAAPKTAADAAQWVQTAGIRDKNVGGRDVWSLLNYTNEGALYAAITNRNDDSRTANIILRLERFNPVTDAAIASTLSQATTYEMNCRNARLRKVSVARYADHNLLGKTTGDATNGAWSAIKDDPTLSKTGADFCREFTVTREFMSGEDGRANNVPGGGRGSGRSGLNF